MRLKVIILKVDPVKEIFDETPLNTFCLKNKFVSSDEHDILMTILRKKIKYENY